MSSNTPKEDRREQRRDNVAVAPAGRKRLNWYGPGLLWMVSSVGSGSVLFTPRVGSRYGYELLWAVLLVAFLTWVIIREIGRYTVVSGRTILDGYYSIPGPRRWAVWLIFLPGLASGIVVVAGIAALIGSALGIILPGRQAFFSVSIILVSAVLVISGRYNFPKR
ncbi:MAG: Nramp family divalent metal transporter [Nitrospirota bacterium]